MYLFWIDTSILFVKFVFFSPVILVIYLFQKVANFLTFLLVVDGEHLTSGELDEYIRQVVTTGPLQEVAPDTVPPKDIMR